MKWHLILSVLLTIGLVEPGKTIQAQGLSNVFSQSKAMLQYYAEEIAALQLYIGKAEKGFQIAENGWQDIQSIKQGDFNIHSTFFASLAAINPSIAKMSQVAEIIALQISIVNQFSGSLKHWQSTNTLSGGELDYIGKVYANVCAAGLADVNALIALITANTYKMSDDQRMQGIQALDEHTRDQYAFTMDFTNRTEMLSEERLAGQNDYITGKALYGLP